MEEIQKRFLIFNPFSESLNDFVGNRKRAAKVCQGAKNELGISSTC